MEGYLRPPRLQKSDLFYRVLESVPTSIVNSGSQEHQILRNAMSPGFSSQSLRSQEPQIGKYVDLLIERLREKCNDGDDPLDLCQWYNWATFDIVGDLVFSESFGCLEQQRMHPFISMILGSSVAYMMMLALCCLGFKPLVQVIAKIGMMTQSDKLDAEVKAMLQRRLALKETREDLFEGVGRHMQEQVCSPANDSQRGQNNLHPH